MKLKCPKCHSTRVELLDENLHDDVTNNIFDAKSFIALQFSCSDCDEMFEAYFDLSEIVKLM